MQEKVEFHCHTSNSFDCKVSFIERLEHYSNLKFTHLAITDHDAVLKIDDYLSISKSNHSLKVIPGIEVTTHVGHIILLNCKYKPWVNSLFFLVIWSKLFDCNIYVPHPCRKGTGLLVQFVANKLPTWYIAWFLKYVHFIEVWNPRDSIKDKINLNIKILHNLKKCKFVVASDSHYTDDIFIQGCTMEGLPSSNPLVIRFFEEKIIVQENGVIPLTMRASLRYIKSALRYLINK